MKMAWLIHTVQSTASRLVDVGITPETDGEDVVKIRVTNRLNVIGFPVGILFVVVFTCLGQYVAATTLLFSTASILGSFALNYLHLYPWAPALGVTGSAVAIGVASYLSSAPLGGEYILIALLGMPLLMIPLKNKGLLMTSMTLPTLIIVALQIFPSPSTPMIEIDAQTASLVRTMSLTSGGLLLLANFYYFYVEMQRRESVIIQQQAVLMDQAGKSDLGLLAAGVAHEINNPLMVIQGRAQILLHKLDHNGVPSGTLVRESCLEIEKATARVARIIGELRHLSRDAAQDPFEVYSIANILNVVHDLCGERAQRLGVQLQIKAPSSDVELNCRPVQIEQVLLALISNSMDAVETQAKRWISISVVDLVDSVDVSVSDSGPAISKEVASKLMKPFYTTEKIGRGVGLGLSTARSIVEAHGGKLRYDADAPHTTFRLSLPKSGRAWIKEVA